MIKMDMKRLKIDKFLKDLYRYYGNDPNKTTDSIYYFLTKYSVPKEERELKISSFFSEWKNYFRNVPNINVFVNPNWSFFCQFTNMKKNMKQLDNPIKIYLHVGSKDILEVAKILFKFLADNNIIHESKIGSEVRLDDIVIRVYSKSDYIKITEFIEKTPRIKNALRDSFPISFSDKKVSCALDRDLSFNKVLAQYLNWYAFDSKKANKKNVSVEDFFNYIVNIYKSVFIYKNKSDIALFLERYTFNPFNLTNEFLLNNYQEITKVILESIKDNTTLNYFNVIDFCNNRDLYEARINDYSYALGYNNISEADIYLVVECILTMSRKYGVEQTIKNLNSYINEGRIARITRDNNIQNRFKSMVPSTKLKVILGRESVKSFVERVTGTPMNDNEIMRHEYAKMLLEMAVLETYNKYGMKQTKGAIFHAIKENDYGYFTNEKGLRDKLQRSVTIEQLKYLVNELTNGYPSDYVQIVLGNYGYDVEFSKSR